MCVYYLFVVLGVVRTCVARQEALESLVLLMVCPDITTQHQYTLYHLQATRDPHASSRNSRAKRLCEE